MQFICLFRGINVSGQKLIKMQYLKELFSEAGFSEIRTYIQSGNVIFESDITDENEINRIIGYTLLKSLGYHTISFIRNFSEWARIIENNPFPQQSVSPDYKYYVTFFAREPDEKLAEKLFAFASETEKFVIIGREMYVLLKKQSDTKQIFSNNFVENKLKMEATTRNWNTILKIPEYKN